MTRDERYMKEAIRQAKKAYAIEEVPIGCVIVYEDHIDVPFPNGESLKDVEVRVQSFINDILKEYKGKTIGIVAHRAPQLAFEVITKNISWETANENDWRKTGNWKPGWKYEIV